MTYYPWQFRKTVIKCYSFSVLHTSHSIDDAKNDLINSNDKNQEFHRLIESFVARENPNHINGESQPRANKKIYGQNENLKNEKRVVKTVTFIHKLIEKLTTVGKLKLSTLSLNLKSFVIKNNVASSDLNIKDNNLSNDRKTNKKDIDINSAAEENGQWDNNWDDWGGKKTIVDSERQKNAKRKDYFENEKPLKQPVEQETVDGDLDNEYLKIVPKLRDNTDWDFAKNSDRRSILDLLENPVSNEAEEKKREGQKGPLDDSSWGTNDIKAKSVRQNVANQDYGEYKYLGIDKAIPENYWDKINGKEKLIQQDTYDGNEKLTNYNEKQNKDSLGNANFDEIMEDNKMQVNNSRVGRKLQSVQDEYSIVNTANLKESNKMPTDSVTDIEKYKDQFEEKMQDLHLKAVKVFLGIADHKSLALHVIDEYVDLLTDVRKKIFRAYDQHFALGDDIIQKHWAYLKESILADADDEKVRLLRYLCDRRVVCKLYPAFSDHLSDFIEVILLLPDQNLRLVLKSFSEQEKERDFIMNLLFSDSHEITKIVTRFLKGNISETKVKILRAVSLFVINKFKIFSSNNKDVNDKVKALKILMDIVDKAFEADVTEITFSDLRTGIEKWIDETSYDTLQKAVASFLRHVTITIGDRVTDEAKREIKALTAFVVFDEANDTLYQLLEDGSRFVEPRK